MTSRTTEIQTLIADIEGLLAHKGKRLNRVLAQEQNAREILEKVHTFLVSLQESDAVVSQGESDSEQQQLSPLLARFINQSSQLSSGEEAQNSGELGASPSTELRTLLEPLRTEMQTLLQERAKLVEEIRLLEQKRLQNYSLAQQVANQEKVISEFLQVLMNRIRSNVSSNVDAQTQDFTQQVGQKVEQKALPQFGVTSSSVPSSNLNPEASIISSTPALSDSLDQLQQLTRLTGDLDHRLLALDSTVNAVFNALERNIITYHDSLSESLSRMHSKGVQGEKLLTNLIDNLTQSLRSDDITQNVSQNQTGFENHTNFTNLDSLASQTEDIQLSALTQGSDTDPETSENQTSLPDLDSILLKLDGVGNDTLESLLGNSTDENPAGLQFEDTQTPESEPWAVEDVDDLYASLFSVGDLASTTENYTEKDTEHENLEDSSDQNANITDTENGEQGAKIDTSILSGSEFFSDDTPTVSSEVEDKKPVTQTNFDDFSVDTPTVNSEVEDKKPVTQTNFDDFSVDTPTASNEVEDKEPVTQTNFDVANWQNIADVTEKLEVENLESPALHIETPIEAGDHSLNSDREEPTTSLSIESAHPETETQGYSSTDGGNTPDTPTVSEVRSEDIWNTFSFEEDKEAKTEETNQSGESIFTDQVLKSDTTPELDNLPNSSDTITALTDLLGQLGIQGEMFGIETSTRGISKEDRENQNNLDAVNIAENEKQISNTDRPDTSDNYLRASPEENLLAQDQAATDTPQFDISLNLQQQQQLDWDLTNFDAEQTPESQPENQPENSVPPSTSASDLPKLEISAWETPPAKSNLSPTGKCADTELDLSPTLGLTGEIENKNIVITDSKTSNLSSSTGDTDGTQVDDNIKNSVWYLGIDLGTTGISAVLLNRSSQEVYPLYWSTPSQPQLSSVQRSFRLPAEVYLPSSTFAQRESKSKESTQQTSVAAEPGSEISSNQGAQTEVKSPPALNNNLFSAHLKPYLKVALPYKSNSQSSLNKGSQKWEPLLQLNELSTVPLVWVVRSLSKLLLTLKSDSKSTTLGLTAAADGLTSETFAQIIDRLAGVICTCPSNSSEQYRFNVREALLTSKLVQHPQQVFFVEEAVAGLLSELDGARGETVKFRGSKRYLFSKASSHTFVGNTLIVNIGASATEMGLVDVPQNLHELTHNKFMLHNFFYAGKSIDQDIVCQLLIPEKWRESRLSNSESATNKSNTSWQSSVPGLEQMRLSSLGLDKLELPRPGEPDISARIRLQQRLESSVLGQAILNAAGALKLILQQQESFTIELADQRWILQRRDLESQVFVPFVRRLNREINRLLVARGIPTEAVDQAILTGGVASLGSVSRWLRQKLPNAKIIQDSYLGEENTPKCTRVAYGLALLTLHPQVLEIPRQQYTDYFLFTELLRLLPQRNVSFGEIVQLFEGRGINTRSCQQRLLAFLEGELPQGLIPEAENSQWITYSSLENSQYKAIANVPLFEKQGSLTYRPNLEQLEHLRRYLDVVQASTQQSLEEPYTVNFVVGVQKD